MTPLTLESGAKVHAIADRRPTTDDRRRRVVAELSLQLRKIATPPVTVVFQPFRTAYLQRHPDNWSGQTEHALETRFSVLLI